MITVREAEAWLGDRVVYVPNGEQGYIQSISPSEKLIMVQYDGDTGGAKATRPEDLEWQEEERS